MLIENKGGEQTVAENAFADYENTFARQLEKGMSKYGVVLKTFNGRDAGKDAFEELVDLSVYLEQLRMEHVAFAEILWLVLYTCRDAPIIPQKLFDKLVEAYEGKEQELAKKWGIEL